MLLLSVTSWIWLVKFVRSVSAPWIVPMMLPVMVPEMPPLMAVTSPMMQVKRENKEDEQPPSSFPSSFSRPLMRFVTSSSMSSKFWMTGSGSESVSSSQPWMSGKTLLSCDSTTSLEDVTSVGAYVVVGLITMGSVTEPPLMMGTSVLWPLMVVGTVVMTG